jgi:hypothetical protein
LDSNVDQARMRADASFRKEERARDGAKAMTEYETAARAVREKTARLRALRLAKELAEKEAKPVTSKGRLTSIKKLRKRIKLFELPG